MASEPRQAKQNNILKVTILINRKEDERSVPTCWDDVSFGKFLKLESCQQDIVAVIALFVGIDYDILRRSKIINMDSVIATLKFLTEPMVPAVPKTILGYPVPPKLEFEQVQMYLDLKDYVSKAKELTPLQQLESYTLYCAVYACRSKHKEYDWEKAEAMRDEFLQAPCTEVMGIGNFTLLKLIGLKNNIDVTSRKPDSLIKKLKLVLAYLRIRTVLFLRSFNWRKRLI